MFTVEFNKASELWKLQEVTAVKAMQENGMKKTTFYRLVSESTKNHFSFTYIYRRNSFRF